MERVAETSAPTGRRTSGLGPSPALSLQTLILSIYLYFYK